MGSSVKMRFRTDGAWHADWHARLLRNDTLPEHVAESLDRIKATPPAEPGDVWRMTWSGEADVLAGYIICCPRCLLLHHWCQANNCTVGPKCEDCRCTHSCTKAGTLGSCWSWTGVAEENSLSASPSLHASGEGSCGWHGWLRNGELVEC